MESEKSSCQFLNSLYPKQHILANERMSGRNWFTPGGEEILKESLLKMKLRPGDSVLDIGCGSGGSALYMAKYCGVNVHGVDASSNMIDFAKDRLAKEDIAIRDKVHFELADITQVNYESNSYDVVYSQATLMLIPDKKILFNKIYKWLKPGGKLYIGVICGGEEQDKYPKDLVKRLKERKMDLTSLNGYSKLIEAAGFKDVEAEDDSKKNFEYVERDLKHFQETKEAILKDFSEEDFDDVVKLWTGILKWSRSGEYRSGVLQARK